ncbi:unnamed protein product [Larinioides sclopetarius]|uniref:LolA-like domain-containing protein n=1 Tax=Larinioides sclopetarius TaxID=280406 RepID=A0AAV1Z9L7_9ARAC
MIAIRNSFIAVAVLLLCIHFCCGQGNAAKPKFPPVFQVEVQGIFKNEKKEMVGTIYYDGKNNRGAFHFTYQGVTTQTIYRFDDNELLHISGSKCVVTSTRNDSANIFFLFSSYWKGKTILAKPEELFFFTNSTFDSEGTAFPSYIYKVKLNLPVNDGSTCEITHIFTKPEMKVPECDSNLCQSTLAAMNIKCFNKDGSLEVNKMYDFFRFKSNIVDNNVFLPPPGTFCNVRNKNKFPGLPGYFSFTYDLTDERKGTGRTSGALTVHKKVWYDSNMSILRMDEFDAERVQIASKIFDVNSGVAYTSRTSLSACEIVSINSKDESLDEMTKLPIVFFQEENALSKALFVGTRRVHGLDYDVWSLSSDNKQTSAKIIQEFYFSKSVPKPGTSEILKLSRAEIYTYQTNRGNKEVEPVFTYLPVNNFIDRLRWEAFDVSPCFRNEQKREFKLKVDGPPTVKDSKIFQEVLNKLYTNLIQATNISALRLTDLACVHDGVKIVEFTGLILDNPQVISSDTRRYELGMNDTYRMIDYLASNGKLSLKMSKDGQIVEYKITGIEDIKHEEEDKNLYSGAFVAGIGIGFLAFGYILGMFAYCESERIKQLYKEK